MDSLFDIVIATAVFLYCLFLIVSIRHLRNLTEKLEQQKNQEWEDHVSDALYVTAFN